MITKTPTGRQSYDRERRLGLAFVFAAYETERVETATSLGFDARWARHYRSRRSGQREKASQRPGFRGAVRVSIQRGSFSLLMHQEDPRDNGARLRPRRKRNMAASAEGTSR